MRARSLLVLGALVAGGAAIGYSCGRPRGAPPGSSLAREQAVSEVDASRASRARRAREVREIVKSGVRRPSSREPEPSRPQHEIFADSVERTCEQMEFSPRARCVELAPLILRCRGGEARACAELYERLQEPPALPDVSMGLLSAACELDDEAACARWGELQAWRASARMQAEAAAAGREAVPSEARVACGAGALVACWFEVNARGRQQLPFDRAAAWRACDAGIVDACMTIAHAAADAAEAARAWERGCGHGAVFLCRVLVLAYQGGDPDCVPSPLPPVAHREHQLPCLDVDPAAAARIIRMIEQWTGKPYVPPPPIDDEDEEE